MDYRNIQRDRAGEKPGARVNLIRNEATGEEYERKSYVYSLPIVQLVLGEVLDPAGHVVLDKQHFLDVFMKPGGESR